MNISFKIDLYNWSTWIQNTKEKAIQLKAFNTYKFALHSKLEEFLYKKEI